MLRYVEKDGLSLDMVGWRGVRSLRAYTALPDTVHMLRLLGEDTSKFGMCFITIHIDSPRIMRMLCSIETP